MKITVNENDAWRAAGVATEQVLAKLANGRNTDHGGVSKRNNKTRFADGFNGYLGEIAASRGLDLPWTPGGLLVKTGDLADKIEVRTTDWPNGHLLITTRDKDTAQFILVRGDYPTFELIGWTTAQEGRIRGEKRPGDPPCWYVNEGALNRNFSGMTR
jgi:hypothetical protein